MSQHITLSSTEAQTLYNTGRLIRTVDCELENDLPRGYHVIETRLMFGKWYAICENAEKLQNAIHFTPPLEVGAVYDVKEPCALVDYRDRLVDFRYYNEALVVYSEPSETGTYRSDTHPNHKYFEVDLEGDEYCDIGANNAIEYTAEEMPTWASRMKATPTYKLVFEEGKLRWYEELKRV